MEAREMKTTFLCLLLAWLSAATAGAIELKLAAAAKPQ